MASSPVEISLKRTVTPRNAWRPHTTPDGALVVYNGGLVWKYTKIMYKGVVVIFRPPPPPFVHLLYVQNARVQYVGTPPLCIFSGGRCPPPLTFRSSHTSRLVPRAAAERHPLEAWLNIETTPAVIKDVLHSVGSDFGLGDYYEGVFFFLHIIHSNKTFFNHP